MRACRNPDAKKRIGDAARIDRKMSFLSVSCCIGAQCSSLWSKHGAERWTGVLQQKKQPARTMPGPGWNRSVSPGRIICSRRSGTRSGAVASLFTSDGQERFYNKELHKRQFEYHRGGRMRPARPVPVDNSNIILFQVVCQFRPLDHNRAIRLIPSGTKPISVKSPEKCEAV